MMTIGLWLTLLGRSGRKTHGLLYCGGKPSAPTTSSKYLDFLKKTPSHVWLLCVDSGFFRIQHLLEQEKAQIQYLRNWCESNLESSTQSAPDSPIMGVVLCSASAATQGAGTSIEVEKLLHLQLMLWEYPRLRLLLERLEGRVVLVLE
jgi:hypothetical protein